MFSLVSNYFQYFQYFIQRARKNHGKCTRERIEEEILLNRDYRED